MKEQLKDVEEFQRAFNRKVSESPKLISLEEGLLRFELMKEENEEYLEAVKNNDLVEVADALGDMLYILCGTILEHGLQYKIEAVFSEIQRSNMSKLGSSGKPVINGENGVLDKTKPWGKILKSENYSKPQLKWILENYKK
jgi:predicted HAD superfamily Cof-like phosphohydrolase